MITGEYLNHKADTFAPSVIHSIAFIAGFIGLLMSIIIITINYIYRGELPAC